jgi:hypothetical protein
VSLPAIDDYLPPFCDERDNLTGVYGKSLHVSRSSVRRLLATLHDGQTGELCHVTVVWLAAFVHPTIVDHRDGSSERERSPCIGYT